MSARSERPRADAPRSTLAHLRPYSVLVPALEVRILTLSPGAAMIAHSQMLRPGFICALTFPTSRTRLTLAVQVVRTEVVAIGRLRYETGLAFVQVDAEQQEVLQELLGPGSTPQNWDAGLIALSPN